MKKNVLKKAYCFLVLFLALTLQSVAQNVNAGDGVNFVGSINGYSQPINGANDYRVLKYRKVSTTTTNPSDGRGQWSTTVNAQSSGGNVPPTNMTGGGGNGFLFTSGGGAGNPGNFGNKWVFGGVGQGALNAINGVGWQSSTDMGLNMSAAGRYTFVFKDAGYTGSSFYVGYTTNDPVTVTHNPGTQQSVASAIGTISATLGAVPSSQENFYVRYRTVNNDFASTANIVQATVVGTTMTASIPAQPASTIYYYIFSSTRTLAQLQGGPAGDIALAALRFADNTGINYSYVVVAAPAQPDAIAGNAVVCANSLQTYSVTNDPAATSYTWTLPSGWSGTSATNSINVTAGTAGGTISVIASNSSGSSPASTLSVSINSGTLITSEPSTSPQTHCVGAVSSPLVVTASGSLLTYQWYRNTASLNSGGTLVAGATSALYSPSTATAGTLYYYVVVGGACAPTAVTSAISGAITVNGVPNDNASNAPYSSGWPSGSNGGGGFEPWTIFSTGVAGTFKGGSDIGADSWGLYANGGGNVSAVRPFSVPLAIGSTVSAALDNGFIDNGKSVGIRLRNASGNTLTEFRFLGGTPQFSVVDGSGTTNTGSPYTNLGLTVSFAYTAANTYSIIVTNAGTTYSLAGRAFATVAGGQVPAQLEFFNNDAGGGSNYDAFLNNLTIGYPKIFTQPASAAQATVCQNTPAAALSVVAYGSNINYQWYSNAANSNVGGNPVLGATASTLNPPTVTTGTTYYYVEVGHSGAGNCVAPVKSIVSGGITVLANIIYYADSDADGFGDLENTTSSCTGVPAGYTTDSSDCDDNLLTYVDNDGDGFGSVEAYSACSGITNLLDCNDNLLTYVDNDGDGYGTTVPAPCGASNTTDCNDSVAAINPGASEINYDGVDNNCNNQLDEGFQITTSLLSSICNTTLASINSLIGITTVSSAITGYRVRVTNGAQVQVITRTVPHFTLPNLPSYDYATTYTVEIELQRNGIWLGYYGTSCTISSPAVLAVGGATQVNPSQCGITLPRINTLIATTSLQGATGYRFKVTNITAGASGPNVIQTIDRTQHWFSLVMLTQYNYNSTYRVEVAVKTNGVFSGFGTPCEVTSPGTQLINCGDGESNEVVIATPGTLVAAVSLAGATQYRFQIVRVSTNATTSIDRNVNHFAFNLVPGYTPGVDYSVRVAVMTVGTWSPFGDACIITSPGTAARFIPATEPTTASETFKAVAYPNPFASAFAIDVTSSATAPVQLKVYDMTGRMIESRNVNTSDLNTLQVGDRYPSGVYNVIVTQGANVETLRVIKR